MKTPDRRTDSDEQLIDGLQPHDITEILRIFAESEFRELDISVGGTRLYVNKDESGPRGDPTPRSVPTGVLQPTATTDDRSIQGRQEVELETSAREASDDSFYELRSPMVGVFYRRPAPDQPPFIGVGSDVVETDDVCILEVMKMFTRVQAGASGTVTEILPDDGQLVEHGQVLMRIRPR